MDEDIKTVENELQKIDKILERLEDKSSAGYESWRRAQAVQKQRDNKLRQLKKLQAKVVSASGFLANTFSRVPDG